MKDNPFARRENWGHWAVAVLAAALVAALLIVVLTKLGGQSNRPDVERAMQPPPREAPAPAGADGADPGPPDARPVAPGAAPPATGAPPPEAAPTASGTIRR